MTTKKAVSQGLRNITDPELRAKAHEAMRERHAVEAYLRQVKDRPQGYRGPSVEELEQRLADETSLAGKAILIAKLHEAVAQIAASGKYQAERQALEDGFVKYAGGFSTRHGITYAVWREMGVPVRVLQRAGIAGYPTSNAATPYSEHKGGPGPRVAEHARKRPYKPRRKPTPEFLAEVLTTFEEAGDERAGWRAVIDKYGYNRSYAQTLVRRAQQAHWTEPPLRIKEATDG